MHVSAQLPARSVRPLRAALRSRPRGGDLGAILTDDLEQQVEIAAGLMDLPLDEVRAVLVKTPAPRKNAATVAFTGRAGTHRAVVVERKPTRRLMTGRGVG